MLSLPGLRAALLAIALLPLPLGACSSGGGGADAGPTATAEPLTPVPAPAGLIGDLYVTTPGPTWTRLRALVGGPAVFLPQGFPALAATFVGLPITVAAELDDALPVLGAAARQGKDPVQGVLGIHVKAGGRFVDQLTKGEGARFDPKVDPASRVTLLVEKATAGAGAGLALGVVGDYLLVARRPADLYALGPYVARTLSAAPPPKEAIALELPESALGGPVLAELRAQRGKAEGAASALLPLVGLADDLLALLPDAAHARVTVTLDEAAVHARATVTPKAGGGPASKLIGELTVGDTAPLLDLPGDAALGIFWRESTADRAASAPRQADALATLLGKDLPAGDRDAIGTALRNEAEARGDWQAVGVTFNGTGPSAVVRAPATDPDRMRKALKQIVDLAGLASFKKAAGALGLSVTSDKAVVENLPADVLRVRLARVDADGKADKTKAKADKTKGAKGGAPPTPTAIDLLYFVDKDGLFAAAGFDPKDSLRGLVKAKDGGSLRANAPMAQALAAAGGDVAFALIADAPRISAMTSGGPAPATPAPLVLAVGRTSTPAELWGRLDVPSVVVQQILQDYARRRSAEPPAP
jgi:hypothetical protein